MFLSQAVILMLQGVFFILHPRLVEKTPTDSNFPRASETPLNFKRNMFPLDQVTPDSSKPGGNETRLKIAEDVGELGHVKAWQQKLHRKLRI